MLKTLAVALILAALAADSPAPDWTLQGSDGKTYTSAQLKGKRGYVLAWFPKAFTGGCTAELESLRDAQAELSKHDVDVFMVSFDAPEKNAEFAKSLKANARTAVGHQGRRRDRLRRLEPRRHVRQALDVLRRQGRASSASSTRT